MLFNDLTYLQDILFTSDKGCRQKIKIHVTAKHDITAVHITDIGHGKGCSRYIYTLVVGNGATVYYAADDICLIDLIYHHLDQTIIDQDRCSYVDIILQSLISNCYFFIISEDLFCGQDKLLSGYKLSLSPFNVLQADLRSLGIKKRGNWQL